MISDIVLKINLLLNPIDSIVRRYQKYLSYLLLILSVGTVFLLSNQQSMKFSGEQALNVLWIILFLPIFAKVVSLNLAKAFMWLRKELWILMGMLAMVHWVQFFIPPWSYIPDFSLLLYPSFWVFNNMITSVALWAGAFALTFILLITSNKISMKFMGKKWKMLHRIIYILIIVTILHVVFLKWERFGEIEIGDIWLLLLYFSGKILEWRWVSLLKR